MIVFFGYACSDSMKKSNFGNVLRNRKFYYSYIYLVWFSMPEASGVHTLISPSEDPLKSVFVSWS